MDPQFEAAIAKVLAAWRDWKQYHDLESPKLNCCPKSENLFASLNNLEMEAPQ